MTQLENLNHVLNHTGKAQWIPVADDCLYTIGSSAVWDRPHNMEDGYDWFGCYWHFDKDIQGYAMPLDHKFPLQDIVEWETQVKFPNLDDYDWEAAAKTDLEQFDPNEKMLFIRTESGTFERLHQMLGFSEAFIAMYEEPEAFKDLMQAIMEFKLEFFKKLIDHYPVPLIMLMDDLGSQRGPLLSIDMYREFIKPYDKQIIDYIHSRGVMAVYHSCGCMQDFIPDLIEIGADVINPLQGGINDQERVAEQYGDQLIVHGGLDNLVHLPSSSEEKLRKEVDRAIDTFWDKKSLILVPNSYHQPNRPILLDEARRYNKKKMAEYALNATA